MANVIKHKRGSGSDPSASDLVVGELAIRTDTGKLFTKMDSGALAEIAGGGSDIAINTLSSSSATGGGSATFNGSAYRFTLSSPPSVSAAQLLVSINGVIQKPVAGTGQPSEGFSVDGNDIILGDAPATGSDFFILTFRSLGVSVPADNSVTSAKIVDGTIVNADINASAAIAGTKISPDFGSQAITTTGTAATGALNVTGAITADDLRTDNSQTFFLTTANDFRFRSTGGSERLRIDAGGNLLLGTTTEGFGTYGDDFTIARSAHAGISIRTGNGHKGTIYFSDGTSGDAEIRGSVQYDHADNSLRFATNTNNRLIIDVSGKLLVGMGVTARENLANNTSGVGAQLQLEGTSGTKSMMSIVRNSNDTGDGGIVIGKSRGTSVVSNTAVQAGDDLGHITFAGADGTTLQFGAEIKGQVQSGVGNDDMPTALLFSTNGGSTNMVERMRIDPSGNVGLGTTSPNGLLHIEGSSSGTETYGRFSTGSANGDQNLYIQSGSSRDHMALQVKTGAGVNDDLSLNPSGGNVGIGTTSPDTKLHLEASNNGVTAMTSANNRLRFTDTDTTVTSNQPTGVIEFESRDSGNEGIQAYIACKGSNTGQGSLHFATGKEASSTLAERMIVDQSGNVGIGTSSPAKALEVVNNTTPQFQVGMANDSDRASLMHNGSDLYLDTTAGGLIFRGASNAERMRIDSSGRVHIGTATNRLGETLHVLGNGIITSSAEDTNMMLFGTFGSSTALIGAFNNIPVVFRQNNTERMRIDSSGDVLIGTTSAVTDTKVVVDGNIAQKNSDTGTGAIVKKFVVSRNYTMSTSAVQVLHLDNWGTSAFEITAFRRDTASPHGAEVQKLYIGVQGSGSNMTDASIVSETKLTKGSIHNVTYSVSDNNNFVVLSVTGDDDGGEAQSLTFYIVATGGSDGDVEVQ